MALQKDTEKKNKLVPIIVSVVLLVGAGVIMAMTIFKPAAPNSKAGPTQAYFYDLTSDKVFSATDQQPPILGPSGAKGDNGDGTGVKAYVFSCGNCDNEAERWVGYLESINTPKSDIKPAFGVDPDTVTVASPAAKDVWVGHDTPDGQKIMADGEVNSKCEAGKTAEQCYPPEPR